MDVNYIHTYKEASNKTYSFHVITQRNQNHRFCLFTGYSSGDVERFNIQSGIHRASYGKPAHKAAVRGVACDNLNQVVVTGCSEGLLKFWHFKEHCKLHRKII